MELHTTPTTFQSVGRIPLTPETQSVISKDVSIHSNSSRGNRRSLRSVILSKSPTKSSSVSREIEDGTSIDFSKNDSPTSPVEPGRFLKFLKSIQRSIINIESDTENQSISTEHGESVRRPLQSIRYRNSETDPTTLYDSDVTLLSKSINVPKLTTETEESETNTINSNNESGDRNNSANLLSINWRSSQTNDTSVWTPQPESNFKFSESSSAKFSKLTDDPSEISRSYQRESNVSSTLTNCSKISSPFSPGERRTNVSTMQSSKHSWRDTEKLEEREYFSSNSSKLNHSSSETPLATSSSAIEYINPSIVDYKTESPTLRQSSDYVSSDEKIQYNKIPTSSKPPRRLVSDINTSTSVDVAQQSNRRSLNYPKSMSRSSWKNFNKSSSTLPKDISNTESLPGFTQNTISEQLFNTSMTSEGIRSSSESEFKNFSDSSETKNFGEISSRNKSTLPTTHIEITHSSPRTISEMTTPSILVRPRKNFITSSENESNIKVFRKIGTESISSINSSQSTSHRTKISQSIITSQEESIESRKYNSLLEREENSFDTQSILDKRNISTTDLPLLSSDSQLFTQSSRNFNNESDNSSTLTPSFEVKFNDISLRSKYIVPDDTDMWTDVSKLRLDKSSQSSRQTYLTSSKSTNLTQLENESIIADLSWANERDISSQNSIINSSLYKTDNSSSKESTNIEQQFDTTSTTPTLKSLNSTFKPGSTYSSYERTKYSGEADSNISYSWTEDLTNLRDISNSPTLITDPSRIFISPLNSSIITSRNNSNDSSTHQRRSVELSSGRSANELDSSQSISESGISLSRLSNTVTHSSNISSNSSDDMWRNSENERSKQTSATIQLETVPSSLFPQSTNSLEAIISQSTWPTISDVIDKKSSSSKRSWTSSEVNSSISSMTLVPASDSLRTINDNSSSMIPKSSNTSLTSNENEISKSQSQTSSNRNSSSGNPLNSDSSQTIHDEQTILNESSIEFDIDDNQSTSVRNSMTSSLLLDLPKKLMCEISELENSCLFAELTKYLASHDIEVRNGEKMNKDIF
ncbi:hypothetical protein SNEBB_008039 [Seison nebaliae]|nr:hypothetical protein SNEBB_008039 [Seison nebaliae]